MAIVKCEAYTCQSNRQGECQADNDSGEPEADDLCCENYKFKKGWAVDNPLPVSVKWKY
jgi:hypothetical protein